MTFQPDDLVYVVQRSDRDTATPVITTTAARVVRVHDDINWVEVRPVRIFCHVQGYPDKGRRLPVKLEDNGPYRTRPVAIDAYPADQLRPLFS